MELRAQIVETVQSWFGSVLTGQSGRAADAILALPEMQRMIQITRDYDKARLGHDIRSE